ncbi:hypothetical protein LTR09_006552 [Extremus antarcticus]|uniref:DUF1754-domain-containing protein n=1 Tax=Extremus antarcticus TaxID=702011 RepID=A0AAJ0GBL8_9PEZI|nr:hypothetical protein LTR09_006552 [Extremus antarcticus]
MPSSDYTNAIGGGLKLKGSNVDKKKKKKKSKPVDEQADDSKVVAKKDDVEECAAQKALADEENEDGAGDVVKETESEAKQYGKTEAQRRHEERRRKRLDERLKREGVKTHKERVEELNKYLSNLSEHHDMPRIGPG